MSNQSMNFSDHDKIVSMLPWFVNRTLETQHRQTVLDHIKRCDSCQREVEFLRNLNEAVQDNARNNYTRHVDIEKSMASVMDRIDSEKGRKTTFSGWLKQKLDSGLSFTSHMQFPQWSAPALAAILMLILGSQYYNNQSDGDFSVLSSSDNVDMSIRVLVDMTVVADVEQVQSYIQGEVARLGHSADIQLIGSEEYIITFSDNVGIPELSKFIADLENQEQIRRATIAQ